MRNSKPPSGNAIAQGAMGGNRVGVAQAQLGGQQALAENQTIANLENQGYSQALGEYNQQQAQNVGALQAGAYSLGQLGTEAQNASLQGSQALLNTGSLQQQLGQPNYDELSAVPQPTSLPLSASFVGGWSCQFHRPEYGWDKQYDWRNATEPEYGGSFNAWTGRRSGNGARWSYPFFRVSSGGTAASSALGSLGSMLPVLARGGRIDKDSGGGLDLTGQQVNQIDEAHWLSPKTSLAAAAPEGPTLQGAFADGGRVHKDDGGSLGSLALLPGAGGAQGSTSAMPYGGSDPVISAQLISENHPSHWQAPNSGQAAPAQLAQAKAPQGASSTSRGAWQSDERAKV